MIRTVLVCGVLLAGCRTPHLGPDTNVASREAFAAQRASDPERTPTFGVDDARSTNAARRTDKGKAGGSTMPAPGSILMPVSSSTGAAGAWPGARAPISLEAR
jgi:hypothetical protein